MSNTFEALEAEDIMRKDRQQARLDTRMSLIRAELGITKDGWVSHERYESVVSEVAIIREKSLRDAENEVEREQIERLAFR